MKFNIKNKKMHLSFLLNKYIYWHPEKNLLANKTKDLKGFITENCIRNKRKYFRKIVKIFVNKINVLVNYG